MLDCHVEAGRWAREGALLKAIEDGGEGAAGCWYYLIGHAWFAQWTTYCRSAEEGGGSEGAFVAQPGAISNGELVSERSGPIGLVAIKEGLLMGRDYHIVSEEDWNLLYSWYGLAEGSVMIIRTLDEAGGDVLLSCPTLRYQIVLAEQAADLAAGGGEKSSPSILEMCLPRDFTLAQCKCLVEQQYEGRVVVGVRLSSRCRTTILGADVENMPLDDLGVFESDAVLHIAVGLEGGRYGGDGKLVLCQQHDLAFGPSSGLFGLTNLGNTCFMNSALQCLVNCEVLMRFFCANAHHAQVNRKNPIGTGGMLVEAFAKVVARMWLPSVDETDGYGDRCVVTPAHFKAILGRFEPRFNGYHQHDSQELLTAVLDRLHEDLNRVLTKPYLEGDIESGEEGSEDGGEEERKRALVMWNRHRLRNDSVIVDHFHGQFKSSVACSVCSFKSTTFDPFVSLSLPIPSDSPAGLDVRLIDGAVVRCIRVAVDCTVGTVESLLEAIWTERAIPVASMVVAEVYCHELYKILPLEYRLCEINQPGDEIHIYVVGKGAPCWVSFSMTDASDDDSERVTDGEERSFFIGFPMLASVDSGGGGGAEEAILSFARALVQDALPSSIGGDESAVDWESLVTVSTDSLVDRSEFLYRGYVVEFSGEYLREGLNVDPERLVDALDAYSSYDCSDAAEQGAQKKAHVTLQQCLQLFAVEESLAAADSWYCRECKGHCPATKKMDLWRLPETLVVHLKRFSYARLWGEKIGLPVVFPLHGLDLAPLVASGASSGEASGEGNGGSIYDLFAVSEHYGSLGGGHYTAAARNCITGRWHRFDDSTVTEIDEESLMTRSAQGAAYILFYARRAAP